jgi:tripartite ATP-independent transporter DctP family solute receptor
MSLKVSNGMMSRRKFGALAGAAAVVGSFNIAKAQTRTLRFGTIWQPTGIWADGVTDFAAAVKNRTNGALDVKVFPSSQLGNERELEEGLQLGNLDFTFGGPGVLTNFDPKIGIFDMPFMFRDYAHANRVMDGPIGKEVWDSMRTKANIRILGSGAQGFRYVLTSNRAIKSLDDMKGQKIRTPEAETFLRTFRLLGANPVGVPFGETYLAIKNGVVDGMEGVPDIMFNGKFYEVGKYVAKTGHIMATLQIMVGEKTYQSLSADHRKIVEEEAAAAWLKQRQAAQVSNQKAESELAAKGCELTTVDGPAFQKAVAPLWDEWAKKTGMEKIVEAIQKA